MIYSVLFLLILFQFKHFLADYPLQNEYMLGKFKPDWEFVKPLAAHCGVHALITFLLCWNWYNYADCRLVTSIYLASWDFVAHFAMDRIKANPEWLGRYKPLNAAEYKKASTLFNTSWVTNEVIKTSAEAALKSNKYFWWALGFDQMIHHLTHYFIIWKLVGA